MIHSYQTKSPFQLESGDTIENLKIVYHTFGERNESDTNIIWVFHALTANSDVSDWWPGMFGAGSVLDPNKYFIICVNVIGSPYGTTRPDNITFPFYTVRDIVKSQILLANSLDIKTIHLLIGGSFGGGQALEFAIAFEGRINHLVTIASGPKESAWGKAIHETQRMTLHADQTFGKENGGEKGLRAARAIGMLSYRTARAFIEKQRDEENQIDNFKAASYMQYQGEKFVKRFDAISYYYLTKCLDGHDVGRDRGGANEALARIKIPTLVIAISSDLLVLPSIQRVMAHQIPEAKFVEIPSEYGHDGFLIETKKLNELIGSFMENENNGDLLTRIRG